MTCYNKAMCPRWSGNHNIIVDVCDPHQKGLNCHKVTTYCTEPGGKGYCGAGRNCHDMGLYGYRNGGRGKYDGVCGLFLLAHNGDMFVRIFIVVER